MPMEVNGREMTSFLLWGRGGGSTNQGGVYSRKAYISLKIKKDEAFIRRCVYSREALNRKNTVVQPNIKLEKSVIYLHI